MWTKLLTILLFFKVLQAFTAERAYSFDEKIDLLYQVSPKKNADQIKADLADFIRQLTVYNQLSREKRIKKIFTLTKKRYLHSYSLDAFFTDLSLNGTYNCVTGTALFSIIFDELGIPYTIVELPRHVFLVAYPESERIGVESTSLKEGLYHWSEYNKKEAIAYLLGVEKITEYDVRLKGVDAIIEEYFYTNSEHEFGGLAGMHFMNKALLLNNSERYAEAYQMIQLARELYDGPIVSRLEAVILYHLVDNTDYEDISIIDYLTRFYALTDNKPVRQRMKSNFQFAVHDALSKRHDVAFLDSAETIVEHNLTGQDRDLFLSGIEESRAIWNYNRKKWDLALTHARRGYELNPADKEFEDMLAVLLVIEIESMHDEDLMDQKMCGYETIYPFLTSHPVYITFAVLYYSEMASDAFLYNQPEKGFEKMAKTVVLYEHPECDKAETIYSISEMYAQLSTYYFRQQQYPEALEWINKAIELDPDSETHLHRKEYILSKM